MLIPQKFTDQGIADPQVQRYVPKNDVLSREFAQSFSTIIINVSSLMHVNEYLTVKFHQMLPEYENS